MYTPSALRAGKCYKNRDNNFPEILERQLATNVELRCCKASLLSSNPSVSCSQGEKATGCSYC